MKEKIAKLLRLAKDKGATEAEAAQALAMASAMMAKYGIEVGLEDLDGENAAVRGNWAYGRCTQRWHIEIASAVGFLYFCKPIIWRKEDAVRFIGRPDVVDAADMTYNWIVEQVERLYRECLPKGLTKAMRAEYRKTFKFACALRLKDRAGQILQTLQNDDVLALEATGSTALVVKGARDAAIDAAEQLVKDETKDLALRHPNAGIGTRLGQAAGDLVQLQHGVNPDSVETPLKLEHRK
jgi:hypothetical protein